MKDSFLRGYRTFIGFTVGTLLVALCIYLSKDKPENFISLLTVWTGIYGVFVGKNYFQSKNQ